MSMHDDVVAQIRGCSHKARYPTEDRARDSARQCWLDRGVDLRVYACTGCGGWHLTKDSAPPMMREGWRPPAPSREQKARDKRAEKWARRKKRGRRTQAFGMV